MADKISKKLQENIENVANKNSEKLKKTMRMQLTKKQHAWKITVKISDKKARTNTVSIKSKTRRATEVSTRTKATRKGAIF